jgi:DNA-binding response OmpR family regulator
MSHVRGADVGAVARCRIAVIDDDPLCLEVVAQVLADEGFEPIVADDLRRAVALVRDRSPDLVILDLSQGYEPIGLTALRAMRAELAPDLPVIVISVDERSLREDEVRRLATATLNKPFDLDVFLALVTRCLERRDGQPSP